MFTRNEQILLIIILIITVYFTWEINNLETFVDTTNDPAVSAAIQKVYAADLDVVTKLSNFAIQLSNDGVITVPGSASFTGPVSTNALTPASITTTGTVRCNEMIYNRISSFNNDNTVGSYVFGAIAVIYVSNKGPGDRIPIYTSIIHYWYNGLDNKHIFYIVMPGYKLEVYRGYKHDSFITAIDNTEGKSPIRSIDFNAFSKSKDINRSCKLFYNNIEVPEIPGDQK
jgi:hypothetical protein